MLVEVEKWVFDKEESYKVIKLNKCCDDIMETETIDLVCDYEYGDDRDYSLKIIEHNSYDYEDEEYEYNTYKTINYCPFCGEKINIIIKRTVDKNDEYLALKHNRNELWEKYKRTDSLKKRSELEEMIRELDNKINDMYKNDNKKQ